MTKWLLLNVYPSELRKDGIAVVSYSEFLKYEPNIDDIFFADELLKSKQKDLKLCQTTVGPHRDDMLFSVNDIDIRKFGSQGQQRTSALSLKLSPQQISAPKNILCSGI